MNVVDAPVAILVVYGLDAPAINSQQFPSEQVKLPAQDGEVQEHLPEGRRASTRWKDCRAESICRQASMICSIGCKARAAMTELATIAPAEISPIITSQAPNAKVPDCTIWQIAFVMPQKNVTIS